MNTLLTRLVARALFFPTLVVAAAILVKGYASVGDGFSAGMVAATGVLLQYLAFGHVVAERMLSIRRTISLTLLGLLIAMAVVIAPLLWGEAPVTHYPQPGEYVQHLGYLEIHTAVLFDFGVFLLVLGFTVSSFRMIAQMLE